ncbi:MAG: HWE histidine kinase domain-containing protein, partial [Janthinobacterium lividum]
FLGIPTARLLAASLRDFLSADAVHTIRNRLAILRSDRSVERAFSIQLQDGGPLFDLAIYLAGASTVLEFEPTEVQRDVNAGSLVRSMIERLQQAPTYAAFNQEAARQVRALTGFDRVMVYKFHPDGSGEVVAESVRGNLDPLFGLWFPASDIPQQARALYERNLLRLIADVDALPVPIIPPFDAYGEPLDMSMSVLRAVSPVHLEYLRNMGVHASMSISILRGRRLWGLIACHHMAPRNVGFERRTAAELFVQMFALLLESRERDEEAAYEARTRTLHQQLMATMTAEPSTSDDVAEIADRMAELVPCDGIGIWVDGEATLKGLTPTREQFTGLVRFLDGAVSGQSYASVEIGKVYAPALFFADRATGLLALQISRTPRDYVVFFRQEVARTINWAGNPVKPVEVDAGNDRLRPRTSFAAWRETVRGQSRAWTAAEIRAADTLRITLLEVVLRLADIAQRERHSVAAKQGFLVAELNHRVRNILGLVNGLVSQSRATERDVDAFRAVLAGRVQALARAHDQITADNWGPASLASLISIEAAAYLGARMDCIRTQGPATLLQPRAFTTLALVIHELMTNSAKYGAIGSPGGHVMIGWRLLADGRLDVSWRETGGPAVVPPTRRGFGSTIIERSLPHELGGTASIDYLPAGVEARMTVPAEFVLAGQPLVPVAVNRGGAVATARLSGTVLLVEDSMIIALDAEEMLIGLGARRVDVASNTAEAMRLLDLEVPDLAMLDVNLGSGTSFVIAARARALGVPIVFATGYGDDTVFPAEHVGDPIIRKPYTAEAIARAVALAGAAAAPD